MRLSRLVNMGLAEVAGRGRQELWKGLERIDFIGPGHRGRRRPPPEASLERFRDHVERRFFRGALDPAVPVLLDERLSDERPRLVAAAESILAGRFDLLGYRGLSFGDPLDWHLDPVAGRRAPLAHWSRLDPLDAAAVGDSKVVWELNRHQWLVRLGQAYRLTRDERYAQHFAGALASWISANPPGRGINWTSSLEAALRIIAWSWALVLFRDSPALTTDVLRLAVESIRAQATRVERYLSHYFSPNTHLTGEALGLVYAGSLFPELARARPWRELGRHILIQELDRQVLTDGVHFERATCYQRYTAEIYLHWALLAELHEPVPPDVWSRLGQLLTFLLTVAQPDGDMPQIGDADGGWLLPLADRPPQDLRGLFAVAAAASGRSDFAWAARGLAPEALWLLGGTGLAAFDVLKPTPPASPPSRLFPQGGFAVMRSGWDDGAHQLVLDVGPLGCPVSAGHGHADLLSIQCSAFGEPYLVDPGTYRYTGEAAWRDFFRSTAAHSTLMVDGREQATPHGPFGWRDRPETVLRRWRPEPGLQVIDAEHAAYGSLSDAVVHRRRVLWVAPRYWIVVDDLSGGAEHRVELRFQFAPLPVVWEAPWIRARRPSGRGLFARCLSTIALETRIVAGAEAPIEGWISPAYGQRVPAPVAVVSAVARLPLRIATILYPMVDATAAPPAVAPRLGAQGELVGLTLHGGREVVRWGPCEEIETSC